MIGRNRVGSLGRTGVFDWLVQRLTAVVLLVATIWLAFTMPRMPFDQAAWQVFFELSTTKWLTITAVVSILVHAWIGLWTVFTDYITCKVLRLTLQIALFFWLAALFVYALQILL